MAIITFPWTRGTEAARAANSTVPAAGMLAVTSEGNVYAADGSTAWNAAARLARASEVAAEVTARTTAVTGEVTARNAAIVAGYAALARTPDSLIAGAVTRDSNGAATSAPVVWPDGTAGTYTALVVSTAFPGAVDSYQITYGSPTVTKTYTQPTITRNATTGAATNVPAITVA